MSENEHEHLHGENCSCGLHEHSNDHAHEHDHDHDHDHSGHAHDEYGNCILNNDEPGTVHVELHLHDEARVVSGKLTLNGSYDTVKTALGAQLEKLAAAIQDRGGIVGHIKASCDVRTVDMFSVTDREVMVKRTADQEIRMNLAAIVFLVTPEEAETLVRAALEAVRDAAAS
jgi:hypothetical protein